MEVNMLIIVICQTIVNNFWKNCILCNQFYFSQKANNLSATQSDRGDFGCYRNAIFSFGFTEK